MVTAEDGILVRTVTGVLTCVLPVSSLAAVSGPSISVNVVLAPCTTLMVGRSEERRVGKESEAGVLVALERTVTVNWMLRSVTSGVSEVLLNFTVASAAS